LQSKTIRANGAGLNPIAPMTQASPQAAPHSSPLAPPAFGLLFALGSASFYGLNIVFARLASFAGISGSTVVTYRVLLMLVLVGAFALLARRSLAMARDERSTMLVLGISTTLVGICYLSSVAYIPVTVAVVVFYTFPILIVLASPFVERTKLTPALLGVAALALTGVAMVVGPAFGGLDWRGLALAFGASIATATQFFAAARCRKTGVVAKVFWIHLLVLPTSVVIGWVAGQLGPPSNLALAPYAIAMTIGGYVIGFMLQFLALGRITAVAAGIIYCAEPVVAAVSSAVILGETFTIVQMAGGALVLSAIVANVALEQRRMRRSPALTAAE
jgi:drug/metabolite transporter (DMT)-like permease